MIEEFEDSKEWLQSMALQTPLLSKKPEDFPGLPHSTNRRCSKLHCTFVFVVFGFHLLKRFTMQASVLPLWLLVPSRQACASQTSSRDQALQFQLRRSLVKTAGLRLHSYCQFPLDPKLPNQQCCSQSHLSMFE